MRPKPCLDPSPALAYVLGVLKGDGCVVTRNDKWYHKGRIILDVTSEKFATSFADGLRKIGLNPLAYTRKADHVRGGVLYVVEAHSVVFVGWYSALDMDNIRDLISMDDGYIKGFIRGFYESEGSAFVRGGALKVKIYNTDLKLLQFVYTLLLKFNFKLSLYREKRENYKDLYHIWLRGTNEALRFLREITPCIKNRIVDKSKEDPWTDEEIRYIKEHSHERAAILAMKLHRSIESIRHKRRRLRT